MHELVKYDRPTEKKAHIEKRPSQKSISNMQLEEEAWQGFVVVHGIFTQICFKLMLVIFASYYMYIESR